MGQSLSRRGQTKVLPQAEGAEAATGEDDLLRSQTQPRHTGSGSGASNNNRNNNSNNNKRRGVSRSLLFDQGLYEELLFWRSYRDFELLSLRRSQDDPLSWKRRYPLVCRVLRRLSPWVTVDGQAYSIPASQEFAFWDFCLSYFWRVALATLVFDVLVLVCSLSLLVRSAGVEEEHSDLRTLRLAMLVNALVWIVLIAILLLYFVVYALFSDRQLRRRGIDLYELWQKLPRLVIVSRFFAFVFELSAQYLVDSGSRCLGGYLFVDRQSVNAALPIVRIMTDFMQICVFSLIPLRWSFIVRLCALEFFKISWHLLSCVDSLYSGANAAFVISAWSQILYAIAIVGLLSTFSLDRHISAAFRNAMHEQRAVREKARLVDMLCSDIKIPTQQFYHTLRSFEAVFGSERRLAFVKGDIERVQRIGAALNRFVDELLFLVKIDETRFSFSATDTVNVLQTAVSAMNSLQGLLRVQNKHRFVRAECAPTAQFVLSSDICVRVLCCYSAMALFSLVADGGNLSQLHAVIDAEAQSLAEQQQQHQQSLVSLRFKVIQGMLTAQVWLCKPLRDVVMRRLAFASTATPAPPSDANAQSPSSLLSLPRENAWFDSCAIACDKIATAAQGDWQIDRNLVVAFRCRCEPHATKTSVANTAAIASAPGTGTGTGTGTATATATATVNATGTGASAEGTSPSVSPALSSGKQDASLPPSAAPSSLFASDSVAAPVHKWTLEEEKTLRRILASDVFLYLSERSSEVLLLDLLRRLPRGGADITRFEEIHAASMRVYKVALVQSPEACRAVRAKSFAGKIVMLSDRLTYLDQRDAALCDYGVPLPCDDQTVRGLEHWLLETRRSIAQKRESSTERAKGKRDGDARSKGWTSLVHRNDSEKQSSHSSSLDPATTAVAPTEKATTTTATQQSSSDAFSWSQFFYKYFFLIGVEPIPPSRINSYSRWRSLNPANNLLHNSVIIEIAATLSISFSILQISLGVIHVIQFGGIVLNSILFLFAKRFSDRLFPRIYWLAIYLYVIADILIICYSIPADFYVNMLTPYRSVAEPPPSTTTISEFLTTQYTSITGAEACLMLIAFPAYVRGLSEQTPWPWSWFAGLLKIFRTFNMLRFYIAPIVPPAMLTFFYTFAAFVFSIVLSYVMMRERMSRSEFESLYEVVLSKDFRDRLLLLTRVNVSDSLQELHGVEHQLSLQMLDACKDMQMVVTSRLHEHLDLLRLNALISKELLFHLTTSDTAFFRRPKSEFVSSMQAQLLRDLVRRVSSLFVEKTVSTLPVSIFLTLDPELVMVRVDEKVFSALLCHACRNAVKHIERAMETSARLRVSSHEILIQIRPAESATRKGDASNRPKFTDMRAMIVTVIDTGMLLEEDISANVPVTVPMQLHAVLMDNRAVFPLADPRDDPLTQDGSATSDKFMALFQCSPRHQCGIINDGRYTVFQRFGVPYLLCRDSYKVSEWFQREKHSLRSMRRGIMRYQRKYIDSHGGVVESLERSSATQYRHNLQAVLKLAKEKEIGRWFGGRVGVLINYNQSIMSQAHRFSEIFLSLRWTSKIIEHINNFPKDAPFDCLVIDASLSFKNSDFLNKDFMHFDDSIDFTGVSTRHNPSDESRIEKATYDALDTFLLLRTNGYKGVIIFAHQHDAFSGGGPVDVHRFKNDESFATRRFLDQHPFNMTSQIDMHIALPLCSEDAVRMVRLCEERMIQVILGLV